MAGITVAGNSTSYQLMLNIQNALSHPLHDRCLILSQLLHESSIKDVQCIFASLVENIFGYRCAVDWGLLGLEKDTHVREFDSLRRFLSPEGALLKLIKLTEDGSPKFEFPINCLPAPSHRSLLDGKVPALYVNKLQFINPSTLPPSLQLNAFEFYFFHFTYFIVNPNLSNTLSPVNQQDTLYAHLLEDYLFSFLPTDNRTVPFFQTPSNVQHSPILNSSLSSNYSGLHTSPEHYQTHSLHANSPARPDFLSPLKQKPSLLKKGTVLMVASPNSNSSYGLGTSPNESRRSETLVLIFKEFYLNQNSLDQHRNGIGSNTRTSIPSHYHVWMVRIFVKHLHFFFNSSLSASQTPGHGQIMLDSLCRIKSLGMTQLIQNEMYCFLKSTFDHWPLDASFRVPLETYLSYIQPWRYIQCDLEPTIWQKFVTDNVLFYTTIFQQILRRFLRMDLSCPKNAYMLFRLTKVLCTTGLREMIMEAEKGSFSKPLNVGMASYMQHSPERYAYRRNAQLDIAVGGSNYLPLFSEPIFILITHLLAAINTAREKATIQYPASLNTSRGFFSKVCSFFETSDDGINSDENSPNDARKVSTYLETSSNQLCLFFREVSPPIAKNPVVTNLFNAPGPSNNNNQTEAESTFHELSTIERLQMLSKKKKPDVVYRGNPDLQPVRSYEAGFLVHPLTQLSQQLNDKYAAEIQQIYDRESVFGSMCRALLSGPVTFYDVQKSKDMQSVYWKPVHLPPRIRLRPLANMHLIFYSLLYICVVFMFGYSPILSVSVLLLLLCVLLLLYSLVYPIPVKPKDD